MVKQKRRAAIAHRIVPEKASSALRYLKSCGKDKKYVESLIASIPTKLKRFKITIDNDSWISDDYSLQIDRDELTSFIKDCYKNNDIIITDRVEETITYDVDSIEAIYYHRNGTKSIHLFNYDCRPLHHITMLSANCPSYYIRLKYGVFLLLPNCPSYQIRLKCQIFKVSAHPDRFSCLIFIICNTF